MKKMLSIIATIVILAAIVTTQAFAAESAQSGTVVAIEVDNRPKEASWNSSPGTAIGAALGGAAGYQATRNSRSRNSFAASALGTAIGGMVGRAIDTRAQRGYTVIVRLDEGRTVAVFTQKPRVRTGQRVYLIAGSRLVAGVNREG